MSDSSKKRKRAVGLPSPAPKGLGAVPTVEPAVVLTTAAAALLKDKELQIKSLTRSIEARYRWLDDFFAPTAAEEAAEEAVEAAAEEGAETPLAALFDIAALGAVQQAADAAAAAAGAAAAGAAAAAAGAPAVAAAAPAATRGASWRVARPGCTSAPEMSISGSPQKLRQLAWLVQEAAAVHSSSSTWEVRLAAAALRVPMGGGKPFGSGQEWHRFCRDTWRQLAGDRLPTQQAAQQPCGGQGEVALMVHECDQRDCDIRSSPTVPTAKSCHNHLKAAGLTLACFMFKNCNVMCIKLANSESCLIRDMSEADCKAHFDLLFVDLVLDMVQNKINAFVGPAVVFGQRVCNLAAEDGSIVYPFSLLFKEGQALASPQDHLARHLYGGQHSRPPAILSGMRVQAALGEVGRNLGIEVPGTVESRYGDYRVLQRYGPIEGIPMERDVAEVCYNVECEETVYGITRAGHMQDMLRELWIGPDAVVAVCKKHYIRIWNYATRGLTLRQAVDKVETQTDDEVVAHVPIPEDAECDVCGPNFTRTSGSGLKRHKMYKNIYLCQRCATRWRKYVYPTPAKK